MSEFVKSMIRITEPKVLIVEGVDEERFINSLLKRIKIADVQVLPIGGKTKIKESLRAISNAPDFSMVQSLGIMRDADSSCSDSFRSVCFALKGAGLPYPKKFGSSAGKFPRVKIMILPNNKDPGELEDLCVTAIDNDIIICLNQYFSCLSIAKKFESQKNSFSNVYGFIASRKEPWLRLGESAEKGYWDFNHPAFRSLIKFVKTL